MTTVRWCAVLGTCGEEDAVLWKERGDDMQHRKDPLKLSVWTRLCPGTSFAAGTLLYLSNHCIASVTVVLTFSCMTAEGTWKSVDSGKAATDILKKTEFWQPKTKDRHKGQSFMCWKTGWEKVTRMPFVCWQRGSQIIIMVPSTNQTKGGDQTKLIILSLSDFSW